jgi:hypothetical protein
MLKRVLNLRERIGTFKASKGKLVPLLSDPERMCDFGYLTDVSLLLNNLDLRLQGRDNLVHNLFDHTRSLDNKLQLLKGNFTHFSSLSECTATVIVKYTLTVADLRPEFSDMFTDFKSNKKSMDLFYTPFSVHI